MVCAPLAAMAFASFPQREISNVPEIRRFLSPLPTLEKLAQLCEEKDTFSVGMADRQLVFVKEGFQFAARLMHGSYVDTDSLIAGTQNTFTVLSDSEELRRTLQAATPPVWTTGRSCTLMGIG